MASEQIPFELRIENNRTPQEIEEFLHFLLSCNSPNGKIQVLADTKMIAEGKIILTWYKSKKARLCKDDPYGHKDCVEELFFESETQGRATVTYLSCPIHGRLDAFCDVDD